MPRFVCFSCTIAIMNPLSLPQKASEVISTVSNAISYSNALNITL